MKELNRLVKLAKDWKLVIDGMDKLSNEYFQASEELDNRIKAVVEYSGYSIFDVLNML